MAIAMINRHIGNLILALVDIVILGLVYFFLWDDFLAIPYCWLI